MKITAENHSKDGEYSHMQHHFGPLKNYYLGTPTPIRGLSEVFLS